MNRELPIHWFLLLIALCAFLPASFTLDPTLDHDTYWHAAVGREIVEHQQLPDTEPFSRLGVEQGQCWVAYSWLWELLVYGVFHQWGEAGVLVLRTIICSVSVAGLLGFVIFQADSSIRSLLVVGLSAMLMMPLMKERPWHVTIVFTTLTLAIVCHARETGQGRFTRWLPLLFVIWANLHIQFVLGLLLLALACLFPGKLPRVRWLLLTCLCSLAVLVNPYHVQLVHVIADYALHSAPRQLVQELAPLEWFSPWAIGIYGLLAIVAGHRLRNAIDPFAMVLLLIASMLAFSMRRDLWLVPVAVAVCLRVPAEANRHLTLCGMLLIVLVFLIVHVAGSRPELRATREAEKFPKQAVSFLRENRQPGTLFNHFDWGGYLIWHLPGFPVSIDGRTNLYGDARLRRNFASWEGIDWESCEELQTSQFVVAPADLPLTQRLKAQTGQWMLIHEDATAVIFERLGQKP